jgi:hypothetical protein
VAGVRAWTASAGVAGAAVTSAAGALAIIAVAAGDDPLASTAGARSVWNSTARSSKRSPSGDLARGSRPARLPIRGLGNRTLPC